MVGDSSSHPVAMQRISRALNAHRRPSSDEYEPVSEAAGEREIRDGEDYDASNGLRKPEGKTISRMEYGVFFLQGIGMLWAWNMFLAAAPYFHHRFRHSEWLVAHFQSAIILVSTVTNFVSLLGLTSAVAQRNANYPRRVKWALLVNVAAFTLLALSTVMFNGEDDTSTSGSSDSSSNGASPQGYFVFVLFTVFATSMATGVYQNGVFAFAPSYGGPGRAGAYTQAVMAGQAVAGVLPCVVQIVSVLLAGDGKEATKGKSEALLRLRDGAEDEGEGVSPKAAFAYFLTASAVSALALAAFWTLVNRQPPTETGYSRVAADEDAAADSVPTLGEHPPPPLPSTSPRKTVSLLTLFSKLRIWAISVFTVFAITMIFPVFTQMIVSVDMPASSAPALLRPPAFIPLAFLVWNLGDLLGRLAPLYPSLGGEWVKRRPRFVLIAALARVIFGPLYELCNVRGQGAKINSDFFYLGVVQLPFGLTNGYLGSVCMMAGPEEVDEDEAEAAGGFMVMMLVGGLTAGSAASFIVARS